MLAESITGVRNGVAFLLMSALFSQIESVLPFSEIIFNGVTGKVSNLFNCPFKKLVTAKIFVVSEVFCAATVPVFCSVWHELKITMKTSSENEKNFCILQNYK